MAKCRPQRHGRQRKPGVVGTAGTGRLAPSWQVSGTQLAVNSGPIRSLQAAVPRVQMPARPFTSCVTLGKSLHLSVLSFSPNLQTPTSRGCGGTESDSACPVLSTLLAHSEPSELCMWTIPPGLWSPHTDAPPSGSAALPGVTPGGGVCPPDLTGRSEAKMQGGPE